MDIKYHVYRIMPSWHIDMDVDENEGIVGYLPYIGGWLSSDVQSGGEYELKEFEKLLASGTIPEEGDPWRGNAYELDFGQEYSTISSLFDDDDPNRLSVTLPTDMLMEILKIWIKVCREDKMYQEKRKEKVKALEKDGYCTIKENASRKHMKSESTLNASREQLWHLIDEYLAGKWSTFDFDTLFYLILNREPEIGYLPIWERDAFYEIEDVASRFSLSKEDHERMPNYFTNDKQVLAKAKEAKEKYEIDKIEKKRDFKYTVDYSKGDPYLKIAPNRNIKGCVDNIGNWLKSDCENSVRTQWQIEGILKREDADAEKCFGGNVYKATVRKDYATIVNIPGNVREKLKSCTLPTEMLMEILRVYTRICYEYRTPPKKESGLTKLEIIRKKNLTTNIIVTICCILAFCAGVYAILAIAMNAGVRTKPYIILLSIIVFIVIPRFYRRDYNTAYRQLFVKQGLEKVFEDVTYTPDKTISFNVIEKMDLLGHCGIFKPAAILEGNDAFTAKYNSHSFLCSAILASQRERYSKATYFKGKCFILDSKNTFDTNIHISTKKFSKTVSLITKIKNGYSKVKTENEMFDKKFKVYASDAEKARHIIDSNMMEIISELLQKINADFLVCFEDGKIYVAINNGHPFELKLTEKVDENYLANKVAKEVEDIKITIDVLKNYLPEV